MLPGNYRAYGLPLSMPTSSTRILSRQSDNSSVDMSFVVPTRSPSPSCQVSPVRLKPSCLHAVKVEKLETIIELSSESEGESPELILKNPKSSIGMATTKKALSNSGSASLTESQVLPSLSRPLSHPYSSIMDCLKRLGNMHRSRNELSTRCHKLIDFHGERVFEIKQDYG